MCFSSSEVFTPNTGLTFSFGLNEILGTFTGLALNTPIAFVSTSNLGKDPQLSVFAQGDFFAVIRGYSNETSTKILSTIKEYLRLGIMKNRDIFFVREMRDFL